MATNIEGERERVGKKKLEECCGFWFLGGNHARERSEENKRVEMCVTSFCSVRKGGNGGDRLLLNICPIFFLVFLF